MNITGRVVTLRAIERKDLPLLHKWTNDPEIQEGLGGWHFPTCIATQEEWYERIHRDERNLRFAIEAPELGLIGSTNLVDLNWKDRNAFHGILLGNDPEFRGKGFAKDAVMALMRYAFEELGLQRLDGSMIASNEASLTLYCQKLGWTREGVKKNWYWRKNRYWDKVIVGITREDYIALVGRTLYWG